MAYLGNYPEAPPDKYDPSFPGNYPEGAPAPPVIIPPEKPVIEEPIFKRNPDNGILDVDIATYWTKPLLREAMTEIEKCFKRHPNSTRPLILKEYVEFNDLDSTVVGGQSLISIQIGENSTYVHGYEYKLGINLKYQNEYTQDEWIGIFIHELLHACGFGSLWDRDSVFPQAAQTAQGWSQVVPWDVVVPADASGAYQTYKDDVFVDGTAIPLHLEPDNPGSHRSHWAKIDNTVSYRGVANKGFQSVMNPATSDFMPEEGTPTIDDITIDAMVDLLGYVKQPAATRALQRTYPRPGRR